MSVDVEGYYRSYGPMVLRRCRRLLGHEEEAVDAMQDVFVQLLRHQHKLADVAPSSLLFRIATNVSLNRIRSRRRRPEDADQELVARIAQTADPMPRAVSRGVLGRLFSRELESSQTIAVLHLVDGMTLEQTAREVGMSVSGVRKRLRTLRARLVELEEGAP